MKNYNKLTLAPTGCGVVDGVYVVSNNRCKFKYNHKSNNEILDKPNFIQKLSRLIFLRGIILFFYNIYKFFEAIDHSYIAYNDFLLSNTVETKRKKRGEYTRFYLWVLLFLLIFFVGLPLGTNILFDAVIKGLFLKSFLNILLKIIYIIGFFCMLKALDKAQEIFKYNYAINKAANAYTDSGLDYTKLKLSSGYRVFNPFNFFILGLICLYVFLPVFSFKIALGWNILIKLAVGILILSVCYEVIYVIQYRYPVCKVARFFAYPLIAMSLLTAKKCDEEYLTLVTSTIEELSLMNKKTQNKIKKNSIVFSEVYAQVKKTLADNGVMDITEADNLICDTLNIGRAQLITLNTLTQAQYNKIMKVLEQRKQHVPLNKILKNQNFYGLDFYINNDCLAPRQDTEILVEQAIKYIKTLDKAPKVLDMCTGSGIIAVAIAKNTQAKLTACDISAKALKIASKNAQKHQVNINFVRSDVFKGLKQTDKFDIIISNPPYIKTQDIKTLDDEVKLYDPIIALDGGMDGLKFYRQIIDQAPQFLRAKGKLMLEIGYDQQQDVAVLLNKDFKDIKILKDYGGNPRVVIATKKG